MKKKYFYSIVLSSLVSYLGFTCDRYFWRSFYNALYMGGMLVSISSMFFYAFFIRKSFLAAFSSYVLALAKNSFKKCARIMLMKLATDWGIHNRTHFWSLWPKKRSLCLHHFGANMITLYFFKYRLPKKLFRGRPWGSRTLRRQYKPKVLIL